MSPAPSRSQGVRASHWHRGKCCGWLGTERLISYLSRRWSSYVRPRLFPDHFGFVGPTGLLANTVTSPFFHGKHSGSGYWRMLRTIIRLDSSCLHPRIEWFHCVATTASRSTTKAGERERGRKRRQHHPHLKDVFVFRVYVMMILKCLNSVPDSSCNILRAVAHLSLPL